MGGFISITTASKMRKCLLSLFCLTHQRRTIVRILRLLLAICVSDTVVVAWLYSHSTSFHMFFLRKEATVTHNVAMKSRCLFHIPRRVCGDFVLSAWSNREFESMRFQLLDCDLKTHEQMEYYYSIFHLLSIDFKWMGMPCMERIATSFYWNGWRCWWFLR